MLGHEVVAQLVATGFDVHASIRRRELAVRLDSAARIHEFDAAHEAVATLIKSLRPATVVNCIGLVKQLDIGSEALPAIKLNALFPHETVLACEATDARLIHISTDCVFSGMLPLGMSYTEDDAPDARDRYGLTKYLGEIDGPGSVTLRTSIIGEELERSSGLFEWFRHQHGKRVHGYTHAVFSGLTTLALARVIAWLVAERPQLSGLFHVASEPITKYELLQALRDALGLDVEITPVDEPVINRALNSDRFRNATGLTVPSWQEMVSEYTKGKVHSNDPG